LIVDDAGQPVPLGTPGELLIKGPQVFAGYWNREEETRKAFTAQISKRYGAQRRERGRIWPDQC
jgi:acyl-CoA synthetase (AMP-forming)/AMP-acid ligase II